MNTSRSILRVLLIACVTIATMVWSMPCFCPTADAAEIDTEPSDTEDDAHSCCPDGDDSDEDSDESTDGHEGDCPHCEMGDCSELQATEVASVVLPILANTGPPIIPPPLPQPTPPVWRQAQAAVIISTSQRANPPPFAIVSADLYQTQQVIRC